jgi:carboxyl-terminal processing protease
MKERLLFTCDRLIPMLILTICLAGSAISAQAQGLDRFDRDNAEAMLDALKSDLTSHYYDPKVRGIDLEAHFKQAKERVKQATTRDGLMVIVAQALMDLDDSHTFFLPPSRAAKVEYGWEMKMIGDSSFVTAVKPGSDAELKGLKPGDEILAVDGYRPSRENMWKMYYRYYALMPSRSIRLVAHSPGAAQPRQLDIASKIERSGAVTNWEKLHVGILRERRDVLKNRFFEIGEELIIWEMPTFGIRESHIDDVMKRAHKFKTMIIDLRGNSGGYVKTMERLTGYFIEKDMKVAVAKGRKEEKPSIAKPRGDAGYKGKLIVLIDSESGSASEVFARAMQLEKRATVVGDRSAGAVMMSEHYDHQLGVSSILYYGASITVADMIMSDGKSLEKTGVTPDHSKIPTGADLAAGRDPVLSFAAGLLGIELDAERAGKLFPKEWR